MKPIGLKPEQIQRYYQIRELARRMGNMSLSLVEGHLHPYRDLSPSRMKEVENAIRDAFMGSLKENETPVLIWADAQARAFLSFEFSIKQSSRGNLIRLLVTDKKWFANNWGLFADDLGFGVRRSVFVFMKYDKESLARLVTPWWDPNVLMNPSVKNSRSLIREVKSRVQPGVVAFSISMLRLMDCEVYFHPNDLDVVTECVCVNAQKQEWWK